MKILRTGVVVCAALLVLSGVLARRGADPTAPAGRPIAAASLPPLQEEAGSSERLIDSALPSGTWESAPIGSSIVTAMPEASSVAPQEEPAESYPGSKADPQVVRSLHGAEPLNAAHPHMAAAIAVQERYTDRLMAHPAVVGTAVGLNDDGQVAILILTRAEASDLPRALEQIPVVVWNTGEIRARNLLDQDATAPANHVDERARSSAARPKPVYQTKIRPIPIGVSTSLPYSETKPYITAGTLGCFVTDGTNTLALSNNHVFANESKASANAPLLQPGTLDGGTDADNFGTLYKASTITFTTSASNTVDAALAFCPDPSILVNSTPAGGYGSPSTGSAAAAVGVVVTKYGRTTGQTSASVTGINLTVTVGYDSGSARFVHQVVIGSRTFSDAGDSGSLIVRSSDKKAVALLFAGSRTSTIGNQIDDVLNAFSVTVAGQ